ncbi:PLASMODESMATA CALLOSE-BINDING PROTEIN 2-like isoform X2 [Tasmannia lanceolata]|uniref:PLASMODESMATA CALLOSE-BINDING PROTEIN 2-like isoform X2 n=1 Tax=Tasmannia lanceolata TaxID=3420 RepID=UPI004063DAD2
MGGWVGVAGILAVRWVVFVAMIGTVKGASWCLAQNNTSQQALQTGLDYACGNGADCSQIQSNGLCYQPNTVQSHASYAYNSYYQKNSMAPGACNFSGTATVSMTDPSYGSCVYPSSQSGGGSVPVAPPPPGTGGVGGTPPPPGTGGGGGTPPPPGISGGGFPSLGPSTPSDNSKAYSPKFSAYPFSILFLLQLILLG